MLSLAVWTLARTCNFPETNEALALALYIRHSLPPLHGVALCRTSSRDRRPRHHAQTQERSKEPQHAIFRCQSRRYEFCRNARESHTCQLRQSVKEQHDRTTCAGRVLAAELRGNIY